MKVENIATSGIEKHVATYMQRKKQKNEKETKGMLNFNFEINDDFLFSDCCKSRRPPLVLHVEMGSSTAGDLYSTINLT